MDESLARTPDERGLAAWRAFLNAHAVAISRIDEQLAREQQLALTAYDVLVALLEAPGRRLRMQELARAVVLSKSGLTRRVDRLEAEGLLVRERCGADRRGAYAVLTERGVEALRRAWPVYARGISKYFVNHLSEEEKEVLASALERVYTNALEETEPS